MLYSASPTRDFNKPPRTYDIRSFHKPRNRATPQSDVHWSNMKLLASPQTDLTVGGDVFRHHERPCSSSNSSLKSQS
jgi:hypothetical protein